MKHEMFQEFYPYLLAVSFGSVARCARRCVLSLAHVVTRFLPLLSLLLHSLVAV